MQTLYNTTDNLNIPGCTEDEKGMNYEWINTILAANSDFWLNMTVYWYLLKSDTFISNFKKNKSILINKKPQYGLKLYNNGCITIRIFRDTLKVSFLEQMFNVGLRTWSWQIPLGQWCITKELCHCAIVECGKKMRTRGSLLSIVSFFSLPFSFSEMVKCEPHSRLDRCKACGGRIWWIR